MKHLRIVAASLLLGHTLWSDPVAPTYLNIGCYEAKSGFIVYVH